VSAGTKRDDLEKKWERIIKDLRESALSVAAYAQAHDISEGSLYKGCYEYFYRNGA
jgi:hypothetical protein